MDHLLFAAEQYAAAQATAAAAAQFYANAAMNAAGSNGAVLLPTGTLMVSQPGMVGLPPSHTWSGASSDQPPAPPTPSRYSQHDDRDRESYDSERRNRRDRSRERRKKSRRDRSRSRSRSRSWSRSERRRSRSRSRGREEYREKRGRERERSPRRYRGESPPSEEDWKMSSPNNTIMIRGLPQYVTEQHVQDNIASHGLEVKDIRLIRKKDTGASRGFAFIEFNTTEMAKKWIDNQQGWLNFNGARVSMQFSVPRDQRGYDQPKVLSDWICAKCGVQNFRRREACFKCAGPKAEYDSSNNQTDEVSSHPTNTVLLSGLDALTTEDSVLNTLGPLTNLPLKSVKIGRDPITLLSRGVCYVEMNSVVDSMFLHNQLIADSLTIDGRIVEVSYHKQVGSMMVNSSSQNQAAANSALAAAQWTNKSGREEKEERQEKPAPKAKKWTEEELEKMAEYSAELYAETSHEKSYYVDYYKKFYRDGGDTSGAEVALRSTNTEKKQKKSSNPLGTVTVDGVEYRKYKTPDVSSYQYDESSGYYYDPVSTLYYDANSQYYFNSKTNKFCYWDARHETFLPAPDSGDKREEEKRNNKEKVKTAKKIQKDMEKWAKTLNQRKDQTKVASDVKAESGSSSNVKGAEDIAFSILQRKEDQASPALQGLAGYASDEEEEAKNSSSMSIEEMKLTDWSSLACLLCKRQFKSQDQLSKHNTMSELHTNNLNQWRAQYSEEKGGTPGGGMQYRDRAKERRNKFGDDDKPVPNRFKEKYLKAMEDSSTGSGDLASAPKIGEDNVGNKMLQKMGWKDGLGLGKKNQGRTDVINVQQRTAMSGLGTAQSSGNPNDSYKENARKTLWSRYNNA